MANSYQVLIDDNFHFMDEDERYNAGDFATFEEAVDKCRAIVDEYLARNYKPGMTAAALYESYKSFGDDPFIAGEPQPFHFSAWNYAETRCREICGDS